MFFRKLFEYLYLACKSSYVHLLATENDSPENDLEVSSDFPSRRFR